MINFEKYGIMYNPSKDYKVVPCDLLAIANVERNIVDTKVLEDNDNTMKIKGEYNITDKYAVAGGEIIKVVSSEVSEGNTILNIVREQHGTLKENWVGYNFRTVVLLNEYNTEIDLLEWSFEDTLGSVTGNLFPCELGSGSVTMKSDLSLWSSQSIMQKYRVRLRKTVVYIFKGLSEKRFLKFTTVVSKLGVNTRSKNESNKVKLEIKTKLAMWYDKDLSVNKQLKGTSPKDFFKTLFNLNDDEVYYANGVDENSFLKINNLHTKEYKKMSEILKAYCSNGVRFCFDKYERLKIFSDFVVDNIQSQKTIFEDLTESTITENESMVYNTISTKAIQRQTMYNFEDLQNKYVLFAKVLRSIVRSDSLISIAENGDHVINGVEITNEELHKSCQLGDIVCFKRTVEPYNEYYGKVKDIDANNIVRIMPILYDKDFKLFYFGKDDYLYSILHDQSCPMDLYYVRQELPIVFKYTRNKDGEEKDAFLEYPILPKVDGKTLYPVETNINFGCASNIKIGKYTGIIEEVDKIYGTWDNKALLYNREIDQFSNTNYPPIYALTNKMEERNIEIGKFIKQYTSFDNSNFILKIEQPKDNKSDATITMYNDMNVNTDIDLVIDNEIGRVGNKILRVNELSKYKLGDVLIINKTDDFTEQEELEYNETFANIRWTVVHKSMQLTEEGYKNYIELDSNFPKRRGGKVYTFTRFPNWSIVYLQELYFRGNPVLEYTQDITGIAKGVNYDGDRSIDIYGEKKYEFDSKQLDKDNMRKMMGYILDHFQAVNLQSTKFNVPISTFNGIDIELLDVITVKDPNRTQIDERNKWVVVSVLNKSATNVVQLKLLNINATNTVPFKLDVKDVLEYKPVEIPTYDHTGSEGTGGENDGSGGDGENKSIGVFSMSEVDPQIFRAKVEKFEGNYIYFKDFAGSEWETYAGKLFPESEFGVSIDGETMLVHSDMRYRAFIKKRDIYNTGNQVMITPESDIKFLIMASFTDIDGQFYSRRCMIGDGDTYFKFHPITGAKFVGDFVIGENNQNAGNDLWESLQKNRTFDQNTPPVSDNSYTIRVGDIWYDRDDENHVYRWNGDVWRSCRDNSIISTQSSSFVQDEPPVATEGRPINNGDTWYDSNDGYKPYVYKDGEWINVTDKNLEEAIKDAQTQIDGTMKLLDDIASDNKFTPSEKQATKKEWEIIVAEYPQNISKANAYSVSTTNYTSKYNALKSYIEPLISDLNTTSDIVGDTFRTNFKNYYDEEIKLTGNIYDKVKESAVTDSKAYADKIDQKVESYASDGVLTPSEKADLKSEIETIESKFEIIKNRASVFGISISTLTTYVNKLSGWKTILSQSGNYTDKAQIATLRADFKNYYTEEEVVYDGIDKKSKELADKAQSDANGALSKLNDIASDDKLTASEKQTTKKDWDIIVGEYPKIIDEATKFGVDRTNYVNAYNTLNSYITPLLSNLTTTSDIVGSTFRTNFKNYYDNRQIVLNGISSKVVEINSMQNGKMLYLDPTFKNGHNSINVYDNSGSGLIKHVIMSGESYGIEPPNDSNKVLTIMKSSGVTSPDCGGFFFGVPTRAGMKLLTKIVACIPSGYSITWASNATGDGSKSYWVTETDGTGAFKEYVHVLECGKTGSFSSTAFFYLTSKDGNQTKAVNWGLSYATVFDAGSNQNDYVTEALGNSKIFYSPTAPISGMKKNDLWYDTDNGNHPHVYNGSTWVSARDKIFETAGGNKVYFQATQPPTTGVGVKDGDMWFNTSENNKLYLLTGGVWTLTDDSLDKINNGRVVINANTVFNGDATVVSLGTDESTIIKGGSITFTRGGQQITVIRNMRFGTATAGSSGGEIVTLTGFDDSKTNVLPSLMEFNVSNTVRTLECKATRVGVNQWRFYLRGTENTVASANPVTVAGSTATLSNIYSATLHKALLQRGTQYTTSTHYGSWVAGNPSDLPTTHTSAKVRFDFYITKNNVKTLIKSFVSTGGSANYTFDISAWYPFSSGTDVKGTIVFSATATVTEGSSTQYEKKTEGSIPYYRKVTKRYSVKDYGITNLTVEGFIDLLVNYQGSGRVQYIAFEE